MSDAPVHVEVHPLAQREFDRARAWYLERNSAAAQRFHDALMSAIERLLDAPERWPEGLRGERRVRLRSFPYAIIYRVHTDVIRIVAVAHLRRKPDFWAQRQP